MIEEEKQFIEKLLSSEYALDSARTIVKTNKQKAKRLHCRASQLIQRVSHVDQWPVTLVIVDTGAKKTDTHHNIS